MKPAHSATLLPALGLVFNSLVWGTSWWPFRALEARGLHPLAATALIYLGTVVVIVAARPKALGLLWRSPALWVLMLAAGGTNAMFNWGVVIGDVVRVILLFYLMPLWTVLLARLLLNEALTANAVLRVLLAVSGAIVVLSPPGAAWHTIPLPNSLPDWLGLGGGFCFALNNVMLRREAGQPEEGQALAMFLGGALVAGALAAVLMQQGGVPPLPAPAVGWIGIALVMSALFLAGNLALQYGATRLPANVTSVIMLVEVVFASGSALALGAGHLNGPLLWGGALIVLAACLSALGPATPR